MSCIICAILILPALVPQEQVDVPLPFGFDSRKWVIWSEIQCSFHLVVVVGKTGFFVLGSSDFIVSHFSTAPDRCVLICSAVAPEPSGHSSTGTVCVYSFLYCVDCVVRLLYDFWFDSHDFISPFLDEWVCV